MLAVTVTVIHIRDVASSHKLSNIKADACHSFSLEYIKHSLISMSSPLHALLDLWLLELSLKLGARIVLSALTVQTQQSTKIELG